MIKGYTLHTHFLHPHIVFEVEFHRLALLSIVRFGVGFFVFTFRVINCGSMRLDIYLANFIFVAFKINLLSSNSNVNGSM